MARRNRKLAGPVPQVPKSGYGFLKAVLDCFSACSENLAATLGSPHETGGNPGYPARQMLRLHLLKYLLGERYANRFLDRVGDDPRLLELCGMTSVPSEVAFSRFKNHKLAPHQEELDRILATVAEDCAAQIEEMKESGAIAADAPALGEILAVDATDIPAYARARGEHCNPPGEGNCKKKHNTHCDSPVPEECTERSHEPRPDPDAAWGYRTPKNKSPRAETGKKEYFFGYDADVIIDAHHGLPLYINVRPANSNEGPRLREDLDAALKLHPWLKPLYLTADKGYHAGYNFRHIVSRRIIPVIAIPKPPKDEKTGKRLYEGLYNEKGLPVCIGGKAMEFLGTGPDGKHRFPLSGRRLSSAGQDGLEPILRLQACRETRGNEAADNGHPPPSQQEVEGNLQKTALHRTVLLQRQAFQTAGQAPVSGTAAGGPARQDGDAELSADLLGSAEGRRLRPHEAHVHQAAEAVRAGGGTQRDAGVRGVLPLPSARQVGGVEQTAKVNGQDMD